MTETDVQGAIDSLSNSLTQKASVRVGGNNTPNVIMIPLYVSMTFSNGDGTKDMSSYLPSGYTFSGSCFATMSDTGSLAVTGAIMNSSTNVLKIRLSNRSYSGTDYANVILFASPNT